MTNANRQVYPTSLIGKKYVAIAW